MKLHRTALAAALLLSAAATSPALAQRESKVDGLRLLGFCTAKATTACDAYLSGVADAIAAEGAARAPACIPIAVTGTELREVVVKYLHTHPETLHLKAGTVTLRAYEGAYPCRR